MNPATVLLVGDHLTQETSLVDALRREGFEVLTAPTAQVVLSQLERVPVAVVLAAEHLSDMDGLTLWREIARRSLDTRLIMFSSNPTEESARQALLAGVYDYLAWPVPDMAELMGLINRAAQEFALLQRNRELLQQVQAQTVQQETSPLMTDERQRIELNILRAISAELSALRDVPHILRAVISHLSRLFNYALLVILVEDSEVQMFVFSRGQLDPAFVEAGIEHLLTLHSMFSGHPHTRDELKIHYTEELPHSPFNSCFAEAGSELRSHITFPLVAGGETIGCISLASPVEDAFSALDVQVFSLIAYQLASAIRNVQLFRRTQEMAITDPLTGLYNRRHFQELLDHECFRAHRYGHSLSLAIVDLDHFKEVNDTLGHPAGDMVLQQTSQLLRQSVRQVDVVARYGGDEFALLLPDTNLEQAAVLAERLRLAMQGRSFVTSQHKVNVTISVGVAALGEDVPDKETLIQRADEALLVAKRQGRNLVCLYVPQAGVMEAQQLGLRERRRFPRAAVHLPLRYVPLSQEEMEALLGTSRNLSVEGIAFEGEEVLPPGSFALLDLTLSVGEEEEQIRTLAQIVWSKQESPDRPAIMGARLIPLSSETRQRIARLVDRSGEGVNGGH